MSYRTWMADNTALHSKKLRYICLPVTHDSGTCDLGEQITPDQAQWEQTLYNDLGKIADEIDKIPEIGSYINVPAFIRNSLYQSAKGLATATSRTIAQQLNDGIRGLDLRIFYDDTTNGFYTYHGFAGTPMTDVLSQIQAFLAGTSGEILFVTCGHYQPKGKLFPRSQFETLLTEYLQDYLYVPKYDDDGAITNDPFQTLYTDIIGQGGTNKSRIILVNSSSKNSESFWPKRYSPPNGKKSHRDLYGFYTNTTSTTEAIAKQQKHMTKAVNKDYPFALYMTLTPNGTDYTLIVLSNLGKALVNLWTDLPTNIGLLLLAIGLPLSALWRQPWRTLLQLSQLLDAQLDNLIVNDFLVPAWKQGAKENPISMIYLDWYETTNVVDLAIDLSAGRAFAWQEQQQITFSGSPSAATADYSPQIAVLDDTMYMIYPNNNNLCLATSSDPAAQSWSGGSPILCNGATPQSSSAAAAITWRDKIHVAYPGTGNQKGNVMYMTFDGKTWSGNTPLMIGDKTIQSPNTPSFAIYKDALYIAYRSNAYNTIWLASCDPVTGQWKDLGPIGQFGTNTSSPGTQSTPALAVYDGLLWVLYIGASNKNIYWVTTDGGGSWAGNTKIAIEGGGNPETNYGPSALSFAGRLWLIYKGQGSNTLYASTYTNAWKGNQPFSKFTTFSPQTNYNPGLAEYQDALVMVYRDPSKGAIFTMVYGRPNLD